MHREICVKDFSRTTVCRILKFGTNILHDLLHCVRDNQHPLLMLIKRQSASSPHAYHSLYLSIFFFFSNRMFCHRCLSSYESQTLQILYTPTEGLCILCKENHDAEIYFAFFFPLFLFSISHLNVMHREIYFKISQDLLYLGF